MGNGRKRKRRELGRVAEIVMVLAASGEVRGGRRPTAAERALAAEARGRLAAAVAAAVEVRPKDLYPREAVRALVEDLGLTRPKDPARPRRPSLAHRILLTKRKMEQFKESPVHPTTNVPQTTKTSATSVFQHGASNKSAAGLSRNLSAASSFPASTPTRVATPSSASKQSRPNETPAGVPSAKSTSLTSSIVYLPPAGSANVQVEKGVNYPSSTQSGATIRQAKTSAHINATKCSQSAVRSSSAMKSEEKRAPSIQPVTGSTAIGHQVPPGGALVQQKPCFSNHDAIAKNVEQVLHQPANHPSWTLPSTDYMHAGLDCQICKTFITDVESLLVCDACERGAHLMCLQHYGNEGLPNEEWYCPTCIAYSKGKPRPPKYGKVTRTLVAPNASLTSGVTLQRASENPCTKDNIAKVAGHDQKSEACSSARNSDSLALNTSSKAQLVSDSDHQKENIKHTETLSKHKEGHGPSSRGTIVETVECSSENETSGASTYNGAGNLSEQYHAESETSESPPCDVNSVNDSTTQYTENSVGGNTIHSFIELSEKCGIEGNSEQLLNKDVQTARSSIPPADQTYQEDVAADIGIGYPQGDETLEANATSEHNNAYLMTLNRDLCPKHEAPKNEAVDHSTDLSDGNWVGDAVKVLDNKTYYNSRNIDGITYNLQDHILIAYKNSKSVPSKLQSLWEEHDSKSKLAMVNPYFFASDVPESVTKPCTAEENEVYASNNQRIIMVSSICGPCDVLHVDKFREETERRNQVVSSDGRLHPVFFFRWKYDESMGSFVSVDSSMGS